MPTVNLFGDLALDTTVEEVAAAILALTGTRDVAAVGDQKGIPALVLRGDADSIGTADGDLSMIRVDEEGRVKVASKTASFPVTSGNLTASAQTVIVDVRRSSNVMLHVKNTGSVTHAAGQYAFEGSLDSTNGTDGTWFAVQGIRTNANTIETATGTLSMTAGAGLAYAWEASVNAIQWFRVRCTTTPTASSIATWTIQRGSYATEPIPGSQVSGTQPVSGTVTANTTPTAGTTGNLVTAATTNATSWKTSAGNLFEITVSNPTATATYVKLYNKASAPTVGTDTPVLTIPVAAGACVPIQFGAQGKRFATGIALAATGAAASTDTTATVAGIQINATYI
jgi:hypothetical protein